jgi:dolichol kinase
MSFGDGMGELVGRKYGRHLILRRRTAEGSAAVFISTFVSIIVLNAFYFSLIDYSQSSSPAMLLPFGAAVAGIVTCLEAVTPGRIDNLVIPLSVGLYLHMLGV